MQIMQNWDDMRIALEVVRQGKISAAASVLGINHTTVSRRISELEKAMGVRLFDRLHGGFKATQAGHDLARAAQNMEAERMALDLRLGGLDRVLKGKIVVTASQLLVQTHLNAMFAEFVDLHPEIELLVLASNDLLNLNRREADVAIRINNEPPETLIGQRLCTQRTGIFATKEYAEQVRVDPAAVVNWVGFKWWAGVPKASLAQYPNPRIKITYDDMVAVFAAVKQGIGLGRMPLFLGHSDPVLTRLTEIASQPYIDIWLLSHRDLKEVKRLRIFKAFIASRFRAIRHRFDDQITVTLPA